MPGLQDIIADKTKYPDEMKITLADGVETTIGDLRGGYLRQSDYTRRSQELARERDSFQQERQSFEQAKTQAEIELSQAAERVMAGLQNRGQQPTVDDVQAAMERDPIARRLMEQQRKLDEGLAELKKQQSELAEATKRAEQQRYIDLHNRMAAQLAQQHQATFGEPLDVEALRRHAQSTYTPRLDVAYKDMFHDKLVERERTKAREEAEAAAYEKAKRDLAQPAIPQQRLVTHTFAENAPKNFDEAVNAALNDTEILSIASGAPAPDWVRRG